MAYLFYLYLFYSFIYFSSITTISSQWLDLYTMRSSEGHNIYPYRAFNIWMNASWQVSQTFTFKEYKTCLGKGVQSVNQFLLFGVTGCNRLWVSTGLCINRSTNTYISLSVIFLGFLVFMYLYFFVLCFFFFLLCSSKTERKRGDLLFLSIKKSHF